ncbi:hypothetical protein PASE110613_14135 [Paenibacillus sediminis]|uniref:DUF3918 domain-containing protein n=1 Tax=Paenibacillus sediminis TaxID=664909 RepID=A0ABS4H5Y1_9BACL|nr:hypothetical protein [Paenibacillus sediminis]MBP1937929.1 hypothetical protein [Paenibacillus sediminis]
MQRVMSILGRMNNRRTILSLLALGVGATALGWTRRRMSGNARRQMLQQPFRRMIRAWK